MKRRLENELLSIYTFFVDAGAIGAVELPLYVMERVVNVRRLLGFEPLLDEVTATLRSGALLVDLDG